MKPTTKIESIKVDRDGRKLIAFSYVINFKKSKPQVTPCIFADYKDGLLRIFKGNDRQDVKMDHFSDALNYLRFRY